MDKRKLSPDTAVLRDHFSRFLRSSSRTKAPLLDALKRLTERRLDGVIFGGTLRDLMIHGPSTEPRDVDVVVDGISIDDLSNLFRDVLVRRTRFGGLHLCVKGWMVDVWPLSQTWALKEFAIEGGDFEALTRTTFLNVEAVAIDLAVRGRFRQVHSCGFFEAVKSCTLDINLEENPFPELAAIRALITASKLRYKLSRRLAKYIIRQAHRTPLEQFVDAQMSHYGYVICNTEVMHRCLKAIQSQIPTRHVVTVPINKRPVQLSLWKKTRSFSPTTIPPVRACDDTNKQQIAQLARDDNSWVLGI